ncbi:hypothetical protein Tsubulata_016540 [Turnera subulata]|uniref:Uncharacterized protein n=1 Tax=Turnera subulata TaxID=218843 RepID=A0A9Q0J656_9ROSI|nr:hypothetical protein Tsubulata_016540 [Turnera subulata]
MPFPVYPDNQPRRFKLVIRQQTHIVCAKKMVVAGPGGSSRGFGGIGGMADVKGLTVQILTGRWFMLLLQKSTRFG